MTILADMQGLQPGSIWEGFEVDLTMFGEGYLRFHGYKDTGSIWWQGNEYSPWPIEATGFEITGAQQPVPTVSVGNLDGSIAALCLFFDDLVGAVVTRRRTLTRYLDAVNFPGGINAEADPGESFPAEIWFVERKQAETPQFVTFELATPLAFQNKQLPGRQIVANHCPWTYRSAECSYAGGPVATITDTPTADSALDRCSKKLTGCRLRFGNNKPLPFGGFAAAGLVQL